MGVIQDFTGDSLKIGVGDDYVEWFIDTVTSPGIITWIYDTSFTPTVRVYLDDVLQTDTINLDGTDNTITVTDNDTDLKIEIDNGETYDPNNDYGNIYFEQYTYAVGDGEGRSAIYSFNEDFSGGVYNESWDITENDIYGVLTSSIISEQLTIVAPTNSNQSTITFISTAAVNYSGSIEIGVSGTSSLAESGNLVWLYLKPSLTPNDYPYTKIVLFPSDYSLCGYTWMESVQIICESPGTQISLPFSEMSPYINDSGFIELYINVGDT